MIVNQNAFDIGQLAENLSSGYYAHLAAMTVAVDPRARVLAPPIVPGNLVPIGFVTRNDGTHHAFHFLHYLNEAGVNPIIRDELERIWLTGALLRLGDALAQDNYFDRAPELELIRHLRNGVSHGNRFRLDSPASLLTYPAHNKLAAVRGDLKPEFEITASLNGAKVLFDFMGAGDVLDLIKSVGLYLIRMGNGETLRP